MTGSDRGITSMIQKRSDKLRLKRDMNIDKRSKTHCRRGLIPDRIVQVVTDVDADLE